MVVPTAWFNHFPPTKGYHVVVRRQWQSVQQILSSNRFSPKGRGTFHLISKKTASLLFNGAMGTFHSSILELL